MNVTIVGAKKKESANLKKQMIIQNVLSYITKFQLQSNDAELFNYIEDLRQSIVDFSNGDLTSDTCDKCGCNEFLCGHNKRE